MKRAIALCSAVLLLCAAATVSPHANSVTIEGLDYSFRAPATVPPGLTGFRFVNHGKMLHEMQMIHFTGIKADSVVKLISKEFRGAPPPNFSMSILIAAPGVASDQQLLVNGRRGDIYGFIC